MTAPIHDPNAVTAPRIQHYCQCNGGAYREDDGTVTCTACKLPVDYREAPDELKVCSRCGRSAAFRYDDYEQGWVSVCCYWLAKTLDPLED